MMTCRELAEALFDLLSGELPDDGRLAVEQHLRDCPPCDALALSYRLTVVLCRGLPARPLPDGLLARLELILATPAKPETPRGDTP
jgi:anti-sigma factor RsiW